MEGQRNATMDFGAAKKRRYEDAKAARIIDNEKVAGLEDSLVEMRRKAAELEDSAAVAAREELALQKTRLPAFDLSTDKPSQTYAMGLERVFPAKFAGGGIFGWGRVDQSST